jgi:oligopeptide transport system substrate-binding protein
MDNRNSPPYLQILFWIILMLPVSAWSATLLRGLGPEPDSLDIHLAQGVSALNVLRDIREGLLRPGPDGTPRSGVAREWQVSADGLEYQFWLRETACWSNGDPVTAGDFLRAWAALFAPGSLAPNAELLEAMLDSDGRLNASAPGEHELHLKLRYPLPWLPHLLSHPVAYPIHENPDSSGRAGPFNGAYQLEKWVPNASIDLIKNDCYWDGTNTRAEQVSYLPIVDPSSELSRYRAHELHISETIPAGRYDWIMQNLPGELQVHPYLGSFFLGLNLRQKDLAASAKLRQALALAIDRDKLARLVLASGEQPAFGLVPPGLDGYSQSLMPLADASQQEREAQAQKFYRESGYSRKNPLHLELRFNTSSIHRRTAIAVSAMWKQVLGVTTQMINEEWKVFVNNRRQAVVTEVFRGGWIGDYPDPMTFLALFQSDGAMNWSGFRSTEYDGMLEQARQMPAGPERLRFLGGLEAHLWESQPVIPLYYYVSRHLVKPSVNGFVPNVQDVHLSQYLDVKTTDQ